MSVKLLEKIIRAGIFSVPFFPLFFINCLTYPLGTGKGFLFRILIEVLFAGWLLLARYDKKYRLKFSPITLSLIVFLAVIFIADVFGANPHLSLWGNLDRMEGFITLVHLFLFFLVSSATLSEKSDWFKLFRLSIFASVIVSIIALAQLAGFLGVNTSDGRLDSTFGNATYLALYLLMNIFIAFLLSVWERNTKTRTFYLAVIPLEIFVLYFTGTRGSMLALFFGILTMAGLFMFLEPEWKVVKKIAACSMFAIFLIIGSFFFLRNSSLVKNNVILNRFTEISISQIKNQTRYHMWAIGLKGFKDHPIIGQGQENFNLLYNKYYQPSLFKTGESSSNRAHNVLIEWLVAGGILGLLGYLVIYLSVFYCIWRSRNKNFDTAEKIILSGFFVAYLANNSLLFDNITSYIIFFSLLAFVHFMRVGGAGEESKNDDKREIDKKPVVATLVVITFLAYLVNFGAIHTAYYYKKGMDLLPDKPKESLAAFEKSFSSNSSGREDVREGFAAMVTRDHFLLNAESELKSRFIDLAAKGMGEKLEQSPTDANAYYLIGYIYITAGKYNKAIESFQKALELAPKKQEILLAMRKVYIIENKFDLALAVSKAAYELDPSIEKSHLPYAISLMYVSARNEEFDQAVVFLKNHLQKAPADTESRLALANAYFKSGKFDMAVEEVRKAIEHNAAFKEEGEMLIQRLYNNRINN